MAALATSEDTPNSRNAPGLEIPEIVPVGSFQIGKPTSAGVTRPDGEITTRTAFQLVLFEYGPRASRIHLPETRPPVLAHLRGKSTGGRPIFLVRKCLPTAGHNEHASQERSFVHLSSTRCTQCSKLMIWGSSPFLS